MKLDMSQIKRFLKDNADEAAVQVLIEEMVEEMVPTMDDQLAGLTKDNAYELFICKHQKLLDAFNKKVSGAIGKNWEEHFDAKYEEKFLKENPPESDLEKKVRALELKAMKSEKRADKAVLKASAIKRISELGLSDKSLEMIDWLIADDEESTSNRLNTLLEFQNGITTKVNEKILEENAMNPETGKKALESNKEKLIAQYNELEKTGTAGSPTIHAELLALGDRIRSLK